MPAVVLLEVVLLVVELLPVDISFIDFSADPVLDELVASVPIVEFALVAVVVLVLFDSIMLLPPSRGIGAIDGRSDTVGNSVGSIPSGKSVGASVSLLALDTKCANERSKSAHDRTKNFMGAMVTVGFDSTLRLLSWPSAGMGVFFRTIALPATVRRGLVIEKNNRNARRLHLKSRLSIREGG